MPNINPWDSIAKQLCFKDERHMYQVLYEQERLSVSEIAKRLDCGTATLNRRMSIYGIKKRNRGGPNNKASKREFLFHMDQRVIMLYKTAVLEQMTGISYAVIYNYKRWKAGGDFSSFNLNEKGTERRNWHVGGLE